jgi:hypothetical protein
MHVAVAVKQLHVTSLMGEAEEEFKKEMSLMAVRRAAATQPPPPLGARRATAR